MFFICAYVVSKLHFSFSDISNIQHWGDCGTQCNSTSNCNYWSWNMGNNHCYLKTSNCGRRSVDRSISGAKSCTDECS